VPGPFVNGPQLDGFWADCDLSTSESQQELGDNSLEPETNQNSDPKQARGKQDGMTIMHLLGWLKQIIKSKLGDVKKSQKTGSSVKDDHKKSNSN
jgi:hypothetical protein